MKSSSRNSSRVLAVTAAACAACCIVPFAFPAVAATAAGGVLAAFARGMRWALVASLALAGVGWLWVVFQSVRTRRRPAPSTLRAMSGATLILAVALGWPWVESLMRRAVVP